MSCLSYAAPTRTFLNARYLFFQRFMLLMYCFFAQNVDHQIQFFWLSIPATLKIYSLETFATDPSQVVTGSAIPGTLSDSVRGLL